MKINILVLAASPSKPGSEAVVYPTCLAEFNGVSILETIVNNSLSVTGAQYTFAILQKDAQHHHLDNVIRLLAPQAKVVQVPESTQGSACTALLGACELDQDAALLIISANEIVDLDLQEVVNDFDRRGLHGGTLTFRSVHPRYSYVRVDEQGLVTEVSQQNPISQHATAGVFWFRRTGDFVEGAKAIIRKNVVVRDNFFVALTLNELILKQQSVGVYKLDNNKYVPLKTERQIEQFQEGAFT